MVWSAACSRALCPPLTLSRAPLRPWEATDAPSHSAPCGHHFLETRCPVPGAGELIRTCSLGHLLPHPVQSGLGERPGLIRGGLSWRLCTRSGERGAGRTRSSFRVFLESSRLPRCVRVGRAACVCACDPSSFPSFSALGQDQRLSPGLVPAVGPCRLSGLCVSVSAWIPTSCELAAVLSPGTSPCEAARLRLHPQDPLESE